MNVRNNGSYLLMTSLLITTCLYLSLSSCEKLSNKQRHMNMNNSKQKEYHSNIKNNWLCFNNISKYVAASPIKSVFYMMLAFAPKNTLGHSYFSNININNISWGNGSKLIIPKGTDSMFLGLDVQIENKNRGFTILDLDQKHDQNLQIITRYEGIDYLQDMVYDDIQDSFYTLSNTDEIKNGAMLCKYDERYIWNTVINTPQGLFGESLSYKSDADNKNLIVGGTTSEDNIVILSYRDEENMHHINIENSYSSSDKIRKLHHLEHVSNDNIVFTGVRKGKFDDFDQFFMGTLKLAEGYEETYELHNHSVIGKSTIKVIDEDSLMVCIPTTEYILLLNLLRDDIMNFESRIIEVHKPDFCKNLKIQGQDLYSCSENCIFKISDGDSNSIEASLPVNMITSIDFLKNGDIAFDGYYEGYNNRLSGKISLNDVWNECNLVVFPLFVYDYTNETSFNRTNLPLIKGPWIEEEGQPSFYEIYKLVELNEDIECISELTSSPTSQPTYTPSISLEYNKLVYMGYGNIGLFAGIALGILCSFGGVYWFHVRKKYITKLPRVRQVNSQNENNDNIVEEYEEDDIVHQDEEDDDENLGDDDQNGPITYQQDNGFYDNNENDGDGDDENDSKVGTTEVNKNNDLEDNNDADSMLDGDSMSKKNDKNTDNADSNDSKIHIIDHQD